MKYSNIYDDLIKKNLDNNPLILDQLKEEYNIFKTSVNWVWFKAQMFTESKLIEKDGVLYPDPKSKNEQTGASGLFQIMPANFEYCKITDPFDPEQSIRAGIFLDFKNYNVFKKELGIDRIRFMLGAYNAGIKWILQAQQKAKEVKLNPYRWDNIIKFLSEITGENNSKQTIYYVSHIEFLANLFFHETWEKNL